MYKLHQQLVGYFVPKILHLGINSQPHQASIDFYQTIQK